MLEAHKRIVDFLDTNPALMPKDISIAIISMEKSKGTVSASVRGNLDKNNTNIGLDILIKLNK